jgi:dTDP-4-amino-4,6-dideoxygalactose transaminase
MAAVLLDLAPGDEIVMPSYTFVSSANAFVLRGAVPVFVDIRPDTFNLDETLLADALTERTRAVVVMHYGGVSCAMDPILETAAAHGSVVIEDAAHALLATYEGRRLGGIGQLATLSFHETKNVICGEGGALLVNDARYADRARILLEKGTNRRAFEQGQVDKYTWVDVGSSYLPSEILAAFLQAQLEEAAAITRRRVAIWERYFAGFDELEALGLARRPVVPTGCHHNGHLFQLLLPSREVRDRLLRELAARNINATFHYVPLHDSPAGRRFGRAHGELPVTRAVSERIIRLPLWVDMPDATVDAVIEAVEDSLRRPGNRERRAPRTSRLDPA